MRLIQLISGHLAFQKRLSDVEDAIAEIRRLVRNQDADVSDAIEKFNHLSARLAKRVHRDQPAAEATDSAAGGPDPISAKILARRARASARSTLADEAGDGLLPKR